MIREMNLASLRRPLLLVSLLMFLPISGNAMTGDELLMKCRAHTSADRRYCEAYIEGVASGAMIASIAMERARPELAGALPVFCMPSATPKERLAAIAVAYLTANPAGRHYDAASELILAFREAFPCMRK